MSDHDSPQERVFEKDQLPQLETMRLSENRLQVIFKEAPVGIVTADGNGLVATVNRELCQMLGYAEEEVRGRRTVEFIHPDDREIYAPVTEKLFAGIVSEFTNEKRYLRKDGAALWARTTAKAFHGSDGKVDFAVGIVEDISVRTRADEALKSERRALWRMLQASDHQRQTISYGIHDGLAQYLASAEMQFQTYESTRQHLQEPADNSYQSGVELVRQAHVEARRLIRDLRPPFINEIGLASAISRLVQEQVRSGGPKLECDCNLDVDPLPGILAHSLYRIAQEALTNACKYSESNRVKVTLVQEGQDVRLEVRDWGVGFDPRLIQEGHFGLEEMRQRVRLLGGRLNIQSTPGSGTIIQAVLPNVERLNG
jgi:PAS domain S-box-containing protein